MPKTTGNFEILDSTPNNVTIDEDGIHNNVSLDRVKLEPTGTKWVIQEITNPSNRPYMVATKKRIDAKLPND